MGALRVLSGDFRAGTASFDNLSISLRGLDGIEDVPLSQIASVVRVGREKKVDSEATISKAMAGGVIGGIAAGAFAGGITGPVGALIGAVAGAAVTGRRLYPISRVTLSDGRWFLAIANETEWLMLDENRRYVPQKRPNTIDMTPSVPSIPEPSEKRTGLLETLHKRLPRLPKL